MTTRVHLVRHAAHGDVGHTLTGRGGAAALTPEGRAQAQGLASRFARRGPIARIHASPQTRAAETAAIIGARIGVGVDSVDALDEVDFGEWTGRSFAELEHDQRWSEWNEARGRARAPGGETIADVCARAVGHIEAIARRGVSGTLVCVSHCDVIRAVVAHYLGLSFDRMLAFDVDPGSVSTLLVGKWGSRLLKLNEGEE
ncbi:histidine phosphatase family protein [Sphingomonas sp. RS6]